MLQAVCKAMHCVVEPHNKVFSSMKDVILYCQSSAQMQAIYEKKKTPKKTTTAFAVKPHDA